MSAMEIFYRFQKRDSLTRIMYGRFINIIINWSLIELIHIKDIKYMQLICNQHYTILPEQYYLKYNSRSFRAQISAEHNFYD